MQGPFASRCGGQLPGQRRPAGGASGAGPGDARGARGAQPDDRRAPRGRCQRRGAVSSLLPTRQPLRGIEWSLRCPWTWWAGCRPRGTCRGNKSSSLSRKESPPPPPHRPSSSPLLPSAPLSLGSPHRRQPRWAFRAELAARRAAVQSPVAGEFSSPTGSENAASSSLPPSLPPSHRSPQAHLEASLAGTEVFIFLWV